VEEFLLYRQDKIEKLVSENKHCLPSVKWGDWSRIGKSMKPIKTE
jgi:hypothetical protein